MNPLQDKLARLREMFPSCVTEVEDADGVPGLAIDFDQLRQELSGELVDGPRERYRLDWPGKREARRQANTLATGVLRPIREQSRAFDATGNLFIEGDSLDALKLLRRSHLGKINLIYIDPPYNTGSDLVYDDDFSLSDAEYRRQFDGDGDGDGDDPRASGRFHARWLGMMHARLSLARDLLADDGSIVVHIDENEYVNLEKLLAESFGEPNNLGTIVWDKRNPKGDTHGIAQQHEYLCVYCKDRARFRQRRELKRPKENALAILRKVAQLIERAGAVTEAARADYREWLRRQDFRAGEKAYCRIDDAGDAWRPVSMAWPNRKRPGDDFFMPLRHPLTGKPCPVPARGWRNSSATMRELLAKGLIVFGEDERTQPQRKYLLRENLHEKIPSLLYFGGSDDALLAGLGVAFDNPKPVAIVKRMIQSLTSSDDQVLDFFAGSGTTAHAVLQANAEDGANRRFILVQPAVGCAEGSVAHAAGFESIAQIARTRIERAGDAVLAQPRNPSWSGDVGFRSLRVADGSMS